MSVFSAVGDRIRHSWNAFRGRDHPIIDKSYGWASSSRPDRMHLRMGKEQSIVNTIVNRIAVDAASVEIVHAYVDLNGRYQEGIDSGLQRCLRISANKDQSGRAFRQDIFASLLDEGCVAIVPTDTNVNPKETGSYSIEALRIGRIVEWRPNHVRVSLYNDNKGYKEEVVLPKSIVAIVENPFYSIMNEPNSTFQRLTRKLALLDAIDEQSGSGKLDLIIQLPYTIRSEARKKQADERRASIIEQLAGSKYGIAYTDATEHVIQLNRSLENNLMSQIEYLTNALFGQLGLTQEILNGTANEETMLNYTSRVIEPIVAAVTDEMKRKFLTQTARTRGQSLLYIRDPFKLVPASKLADIADKFTRNAILSTNEMRGIIGFKPSKDPQADELVNKNLNLSDQGQPPMAVDEEVPPEGYEEEPPLDY